MITERILSKPRVAVLVDGENVPAVFAGRIITKALSHGELIIKRVYGDVKQIPSWSEAPGFRLIHSGVGKNATDLLLSVEAMGFMLGGQADILVIAASDRDCTHLAVNLRERGLSVVGMGEGKTKAVFRETCSVFHELIVPAEPAPNVPVHKLTEKPKSVDTWLRDMLAPLGPRGMKVTELNSKMHRTFGRGITTEGVATWKAYAAKDPARFGHVTLEKEPYIFLKPAPHSAP